MTVRDLETLVYEAREQGWVLSGYSLVVGRDYGVSSVLGCPVVVDPSCPPSKVFFVERES